MAYRFWEASRYGIWCFSLGVASGNVKVVGAEVEFVRENSQGMLTKAGIREK